MRGSHWWRVWDGGREGDLMGWRWMGWGLGGRVGVLGEGIYLLGGCRLDGGIVRFFAVVVHSFGRSFFVRVE